MSRLVPVVVFAADQLLDHLLHVVAVFLEELLVQLAITKTHLDEFVHGGERRGGCGRGGCDQ